MHALEQINASFLRALRHLLEHRALEPVQLARKAGLPGPALEQALAGAAPLEPAAQAALAQALGLEYDQLLSLGRRLQFGEPRQDEDTSGESVAIYLSRMLLVASSFRVADNADELYTRITEALCRHFPYRRAMLFLLDQGFMRLRSLTWSSPQEQALRQALEAHPPRLDPLSMEYETFALGRALPVEVGESDFFPPEAQAILGQEGEVALAPLFTDREFIGVVAADFAGHSQQRLNEGDLTVLETFATMTGTLLYNVWLYAELEAKNRELEMKVRELTMVGEMTRILNRSLGPEAMARQMLALLTETVSADYGFMFVYDDQAQELRLFAGHSLTRQMFESWVILPGITPQMLAEVDEPPEGGRDQGRRPAWLPMPPGSQLTRALKSGAKTIGLWGLGRLAEDQPFSAQEEQVLATADEQVTVALTSLRLRLMATTDTLTGLYTRGHFFEALDQELKVASYLGNPLSLVILDADHFKDVNDQYGHQGGDAALTSLGRVLRSGTRHTDVCARIGGEEFAVLLPRCDQTQAQAVAEKIRQGVQGAVVNYRGQEIRMTVSVGVASQEPGAQVARDELISRADRALYRAKRTGRNQVCLYSPAADNNNTWGSLNGQ